jgi:hypothetical protein
MNREEAEKTLEIMTTADGGCAHCVGELFVRFAEEFPEFKKLAEEIFEMKFNKKMSIFNEEEELPEGKSSTEAVRELREPRYG